LENTQVFDWKVSEASGREKSIPCWQVSYCEVAGELSHLGIRCGWGKDVGHIKEMTGMLQDILQVSVESWRL